MNVRHVSSTVREMWNASWTLTDTAFDNVVYEPVAGAAWARVVVRQSGGEQVSLGRPSISRHTGLIFVGIFTPQGGGEDQGRLLADRAGAIYEKRRNQGITFGVPRTENPIDAGDGWFQTQVLIEWTYDEETG